MDWKIVLEILKTMAAGRPLLLAAIAVLERFVASKDYDEARAAKLLAAIEKQLGAAPKK